MPHNNKQKEFNDLLLDTSSSLHGSPALRSAFLLSTERHSFLRPPQGPPRAVVALKLDQDSLWGMVTCCHILLKPELLRSSLPS